MPDNTMQSQKTSDTAKGALLQRGQLATRKRYIPNCPVQNHLGEQFSFYDDLVKNKIVLLHLMSIHHESRYPVAANISRFQQAISRKLTDAKLGEEVHIYSISIDPQFDSVERLRIFARRSRANRGWQFLTGPAQSIETIRATLFAHSNVAEWPNRGKVQPHRSVHEDCSIGLIRYGNDRMGIWGSVPAKAEPEMVAERISWLVPKSESNKPLARRGPFPNRQFQV